MVPAVGLEPTKPLACEASALPTELSGLSFLRDARHPSKTASRASSWVKDALVYARKFTGREANLLGLLVAGR